MTSPTSASCLSASFVWILSDVLVAGQRPHSGACQRRLTALSGRANGIPIFAIGTALWFAGHWHYAQRHGQYKRRSVTPLLLRTGLAGHEP